MIEIYEEGCIEVLLTYQLISLTFYKVTIFYLTNFDEMVSLQPLLYLIKHALCQFIKVTVSLITPYWIHIDWVTYVRTYVNIRKY